MCADAHGPLIGSKRWCAAVCVADIASVCAWQDHFLRCQKDVAAACVFRTGEPADASADDLTRILQVVWRVNQLNDL